MGDKWHSLFCEENVEFNCKLASSYFCVGLYRNIYRYWFLFE